MSTQTLIPPNSADSVSRGADRMRFGQASSAPASSQIAISDQSLSGMGGDGRLMESLPKGRITKQEVADVTAQLAIMVRSRVDLASAISSLASQCERPRMAAVLDEVQRMVLSGNTLSESLRQFPEAFDAAYTATIAAAEASGRMAEVLRQLAEMQRNELRLRRSITSTLTYPVLLTVISTAVIVVLVVVVLPRFAEIFEQYNATLPVTTQMLIAAATEFRARWWLWVPVAGIGVAALVLWRTSEAGRRHVDTIMLRCPQISGVTQPLLVGRLCRMLALLLQSGVTLLDGLKLCREAMTNRLYKDLLDTLIDSVVNGQGMSTALSEADIIPASAREMVGTAERTGNLAEVTDMLGQYYEEEAENRMRQLVRLMEPAITVIMGGVVAFVVLSVMLPIFDLSSLTQEH